ncbi:MAG: GntP family permease [Gemmataceae bacterium]|nr:GntP family permease [Gemmataceae bacterium]MDW8264771.1 SLC13 family permease [Gemmataceae bacterium]
MHAWPALCTAVALIVLLVLIVRYQVQAFVALLVVSLGLGLAAGQTPVGVVSSLGKGIGDIMRDVAVILALGSMLGKMLDVSGAAEVIARTLLSAFGVQRASFAILVAAYLVGIPVLFNVGFLILIPIMWQLQRETGKSLLYFVLPLTFSLSATHSLIPPHPGIVGAVQALGGAAASRVMIETIVFGSLLGVPMVVAAWFGPGRYWARRQMVVRPEHLAGRGMVAPSAEADGSGRPSFALATLIVTAPLLLSLLGFAATLARDLGQLPTALTRPLVAAESLPPWLGILRHSASDWLLFLGQPTMALLVPTGGAFALLGIRQGRNRAQLAKVANDAVQEVGGMLFLFGAAGAFKQVIQDSGAGLVIADFFRDLPLSPVLIAYSVAVVMRLALGSATAAVLTASAVLAGLAQSLPGQETLLVLAVANGVTFATQPADSGFWLVLEYCNLSVRDVLFRFNACRIVMSLSGLLLLLAYEAWRG